MKRVLWVLLFGVAAAVLVVWLLNFRGGERIADLPPTTPPNPQQVARGAYLARVGNCMLCHTERGGTPYAGGRPLETPFGTIYAGNLTPDPATGLGEWSAAHFRRALHEGRSRDGRLLYPAFPYTHTTRVTDADADALFAYLRSLPPANHPNRPHQLRWPYNTQAALAVWRTLYFRPEPHVDEPNRSAEWNRGAYLVRGLGHCSACHSARNVLGASRDLMDLSGGLIPMQNWYAPSLASSDQAGVADWPLAEIAQLLATGVAPRASTTGPMAEVVLHSLQYLEPADLRAMSVFLKSLPPAPADADPREVPRAAAAVLDRGSRLYERHCASCHGAGGEGVRGAYPPLAGNRAVTMPVTANLVQIVLHGGFPPATQGNPRPFGMPPFATTLSDPDVAAVLTYIRAAWDNGAAPVSELAVNQQRSSSRP
jgi:mono/diheme cytochrome c family protein